MADAEFVYRHKRTGRTRSHPAGRAGVTCDQVAAADILFREFGGFILDYVKMRRVLLLCPGGLEHGGGIGRQMGYFLSALRQAPETPAYRVIDTRGPWFLGSERWRIPLSAVYLVAAALRIGWMGIAGRPSLIHANITGRGSTSRKLVLTPSRAR